LSLFISLLIVFFIFFLVLFSHPIGFAPDLILHLGWGQFGPGPMDLRMDRREDIFFSSISRAFSSSRRDLQVELGEAIACLSVWLVESKSRAWSSSHSATKYNQDFYIHHDLHDGITFIVIVTSRIGDKNWCWHSRGTLSLLLTMLIVNNAWCYGVDLD
jgi:hypothetical protein